MQINYSSPKTLKTMKKTIIISTLILALILFVTVTLFYNKQAIDANTKVVDRSAIPIPVAVLQAVVSPMQEEFTLPAIVQPVKEADITVNASGKLKTLKVELGSVVRKGEIIGSIDNSLREINLASNQLSIERYEKDYNRYKVLYEGKAATELDYNNAKFNYENAKNQAEQTKQQIADGRVTSPLNGVIVKKNVEEGEFVNTGTVIATVISIAELKASVMMSENDVYRIKAGMPVLLSADVFPGKTFAGTVSYISPRGNEGHNYQVDINIENNSTQLKAGTFVRVTFNIQGGSGVLQIPKTTLVEGLKNPYVYTANSNRAEKRKLVLGREIGEWVEVLSGINPTDKLVASGQINLSEGCLIEIVNTK